MDHALMYKVVTDPDQTKSFGSDRIQIHNTDVYYYMIIYLQRSRIRIHDDKVITDPDPTFVFI
jgi:hypothetical protein